MALYEVDDCVADLEDQNEAFGAYGKEGGPEVKSIFQERSIGITAGGTTDQQRGGVMTFANTGLIGLSDYYDPVSLGKPVIGNFIRPRKFDWKCFYTGPTHYVNTATAITNMVTFRLVWLLLWEFPRDIVLGATQWAELFLDNSTGNRHHSFLRPEVAEKTVVLYDCNHTVGSPFSNETNVTSNTTQAGYAVGPADPGYVVPAVSTATVNATRQRFGGLQMEISGQFDLSEYQMALWRDPLEEEEQQIVPSVICFVCCQDLFHCTPSSGLPNVADRANGSWHFNTRLTFTDE